MTFHMDDVHTSADAITATNDLAVRRASTRDLDTVVSLRLALLREYSDHPIYGRLRSDAERHARPLFASQLSSPLEAMFIAEQDGRPVGILRCVETQASPLLEPERYAYVSSVYVVPDRRRSGVLQAMLDAAERWCHARGLDEMRLHNVGTHDNARLAWDALGFEVVEQVRIKRLS
jgi:GNAT superfamily N-acetyltransferase